MADDILQFQRGRNKHMTKPKSDRSTFIWCDYCNASIRADGIKACLRKTCQTKDKLP